MKNSFEKATQRIKELEKEYAQIQKNSKEIKKEVAQMIADTTEKKYKCERCGFIVKKNTNHYGKTYGTYIEGKKSGWCRVCPTEPHHKGDLNSPTIWICIEPFKPKKDD